MAKQTSEWSNPKTIENLPIPLEGQALYRCPDEKYLAIRVTATGNRAWIVERKIAGKVKRRTLGDAPSPGRKAGMTLRDALRERDLILSQLLTGTDPVEEKREIAHQIQAKKRDSGETFGDALKDYVERKRRSKDKLPLKERTKNEYLAMVEAGHIRKIGLEKEGRAKATKDGELFDLAHKGIKHITGDDIRAIHTKVLKSRGERRAAYSMAVLRAVLNWHGIKVPDNPMGHEVAGKDRIELPQSRKSGNAIPAEHLAAWWRGVPDTEPGDYLKFLILTGCRPEEPLLVKVRDCDLVGARILLMDTKNRSDHSLLLSKQALEIVNRRIQGRDTKASLFNVVDAYKTVVKVRQASGVYFTPKDLRKTFVSIANRKCNYIVAKRLVNHSLSGDVTATNYISITDEEMREGWQAVADVIYEKANEPLQVSTN